MAVAEAREPKVQRKTRGKPNSVDVHVGNRVRQRRTLLGLSQERLASALDLTFQQVQKYERGANRIGAGRLYQLARALDVPVTYFFEDMDDASYPPSALHEGAGPSYEADPMSQRETLLLVRAYYAIPDPAVRRRMLDLMRSMAGGPPRED
ncbi:MAG: helix-turn-helix transcriptional regulator [Alphaproteobacteria bacterium]|nr:helix-turn-helix transcriptional regulator [Alphaproteobacteria bacterium]MCB9928887.1 helix-turn-helix transcriptional regulator [Alphaproteobacteria bacterium]